MLDEQAPPRFAGHGKVDLLEVRRANWMLASRSVQQLGPDWDLHADPFEFLCECGRPGCSETLELPIAVYLEVSSRRDLIVAPGHQSPLDVVASRGDGYLTIPRSELVATNGRRVS
jgi:hypothetical protein